MKNVLFIILLIPLLANCQTRQAAVSEFSCHANGISQNKKDKNCSFNNDQQNNHDKSLTYSVEKKEKFLYQSLHHLKALKNYEKQIIQNDFAENINLKSKVVKIRNKDYLDSKC